MKFHLIILLLGFSFQCFASEAIRIAEHGCTIKKNPVACETHQRLLGMKSEKQADDKNTFKSSIDGDGLKMNVSVEVDQKDLVEAFKDCNQYGAHVRDCIPFECTYKHPLVGTMMTKKVVGLSGEKCSTEETLPNDGLMACAFTKDKLTIVAESSDSKGKNHSDKMTSWMNDGTCEISGY